MKKNLNKNFLEKYSRQIVIKDVGIAGQKKIFLSKILIIGAGGLGCPVADYLSRAGVGTIGIVDFDKVNLSNIHRQSMYSLKDIGKFKVDVLCNKLKNVNLDVKVKKYKLKISEKNVVKIVNKYDVIIDGSDNFKTKFLLNKTSIKFKKYFISGSISKFDGHVFTFDFKNKKGPCLKCFYQSLPSDDTLNCEFDGILGPVAGIVGNIQANEALKKVLNIGKNLTSNILILNLKDMNFRKVKFFKKKNCIC
tara:strand:+ start:1917 stop:2666 length:750 start_codon:yes stop_codon:yes gene_type:complete